MIVQATTRALLLLFIGLSSINLLAQTSPLTNTASITGRITLQGEPAHGVQVVLQPYFASRAADRDKAPRVKTDADGSFRLTGISAGQYVLSALAPGLVATGSGLYNLPGKTLNIAAGERIENIELTLKRGGVIAGRIIDAHDQPLVETQLNLVKLDELGGLATPVNQIVNRDMFQTDDRGVYRIYGLAAGKYKLSVGWAQQEGWNLPARTRSFYPRTFHPDTPDEKQAKIIELDEGAEITDVDIKVGAAKPTYDVAGRVVDHATGRPIVGIQVSYGIFTNTGRVSGWGSLDTRTDAEGEFHIQGLSPNRYAAFVDDRSPNAELYSEPLPFEIGQRDVAGLEIKAQRGAAINGVAVIEGTRDPAVLAKLTQTTILFRVSANSNSGSNRNARVQPLGVFHVTGLRPGKVEIEIVRQHGLSLLRVEHNNAPITGGLEVRSGEQVSNVRVVLGHGSGVVRGQVQLVGERLAEELQFSVSAWTVGAATPRAVGTAYTDARGYFVLQDLLPGTYELRVYPSPNVPRQGAMNKLYPLLQRARQNITVSNGQAAQAVITIDLSLLENK